MIIYAILVDCIKFNIHFITQYTLFYVNRIVHALKKRIFLFLNCKTVENCLCDS